MGQYTGAQLPRTDANARARASRRSQHLHESTHEVLRASSTKVRPFTVAQVLMRWRTKYPWRQKIAGKSLLLLSLCVFDQDSTSPFSTSLAPRAPPAPPGPGPPPPPPPRGPPPAGHSHSRTPRAIPQPRRPKCSPSHSRPRSRLSRFASPIAKPRDP